MAILLRHHPPGTLAVVLSFGFALCASLLLVVLPVYASVSHSASVSQISSGGDATVRPIEGGRTQSDTRTLIQTNGPSVVLWLAIPVAIAGAALGLNWTRARRPSQIIATGLLITIVLVTGFSIGMFFIPSTIAMLVAAATAATNGHTAATAFAKRP